MEIWDSKQPDPAIPSVAWVRALLNQIQNQINNISPGGGGFWTQSGNNLYPTTIANNVGIGKVPTVKLDVLGDVTMTNTNYPSGLFKIMQTPDVDGCIIRLGDWNGDIAAAAISIKPNQQIQIACSVPATVPTGTALLYMGESSGGGYAGFTADFSTDNKDKGNYTIGRVSGGGTFFRVLDDNASGGTIDGQFQSLGSFQINAVGGNGKLNLNSFGTFFAGLGTTEGFGVDLSGGTGAGNYTIGNSGKTNIIINDTAQTTAISGTGGLLVNTIKDNGGAMLISSSSSNLSIETLGGGNLILNSANDVNINTDNDGNLNIVIDGIGSLKMNGTSGKSGTLNAAFWTTGSVTVENGVITAITP